MDSQSAVGGLSGSLACLSSVFNPERLELASSLALIVFMTTSTRPPVSFMISAIALDSSLSFEVSNVRETTCSLRSGFNEAEGLERSSAMTNVPNS